MYEFAGFLYNNTTLATPTVGAYDTEMYVLSMIQCAFLGFLVVVQVARWVLFGKEV